MVTSAEEIMRALFSSDAARATDAARAERATHQQVAQAVMDGRQGNYPRMEGLKWLQAVDALPKTFADMSPQPGAPPSSVETAALFDVGPIHAHMARVEQVLPGPPLGAAIGPAAYLSLTEGDPQTQLLRRHLRASDVMVNTPGPKDTLARQDIVLFAGLDPQHPIVMHPSLPGSDTTPQARLPTQADVLWVADHELGHVVIMRAQQSGAIQTPSPASTHIENNYQIYQRECLADGYAAVCAGIRGDADVVSHMQSARAMDALVTQSKNRGVHRHDTTSILQPAYAAGTALRAQGIRIEDISPIDILRHAHDQAQTHQLSAPDFEVMNTHVWKNPKGPSFPQTLSPAGYTHLETLTQSYVQARTTTPTLPAHDWIATMQQTYPEHAKLFGKVKPVEEMFTSTKHLVAAATDGRIPHTTLTRVVEATRTLHNGTMPLKARIHLQGASVYIRSHRDTIDPKKALQIAHTLAKDLPQRGIASAVVGALERVELPIRAQARTMQGQGRDVW